MKVRTFFIGTIAPLVIFGIEALDRAPDYVPIEEQTFLVYRRYYFVARLDKTIQALAKMYQEVNSMQKILSEKAIDFTAIVPPDTYRLFTHEGIRQSLQEMVHTRSMKPLFMVWDSFKSYKSLRDDLLVEDFSKEIFIITRNTVDNLYGQADVLYDAADREGALLQDRLDLLADMTLLLERYLDGNITQARDIRYMGDIRLSVQTDDVAARYYCLRRMQHAVDRLQEHADLERIGTLVEEALQGGVKSIERSWGPSRRGLARLWNDLTQYKHIEEESFVHDVALRILMSLHAYRLEHNGTRAITGQDLIAFKNDVADLPLEELLNAIDFMIKQMHLVVNHYQKSGLTFVQWIKHYWWAPSVVVATIAIKCYLLYCKNFRKLDLVTS